MGPTRNSRNRQRQTVLYDMSNPENWTASKLREELSNLGVNVSLSNRKTELLRLYKSRTLYSGRQQEQPLSESPRIHNVQSTPGRHQEQPSRNRTPEVSNQNNNGGDLSVAIRELMDTVGKMREEINVFYKRKRQYTKIHTSRCW